jgi:Sigma2 domain of PhyR
MPDRETTVPSIPNDNATFGEERGAATAARHRDIEATLPNLRRYARSLTRAAVAADDLVQECVARALAKLHLLASGHGHESRVIHHPAQPVRHPVPPGHVVSA